MRKGQNTKEKLLKAMEEEILEKGYDNTTLTSIAARAGVTPSLISYHLKNMPYAANMLFTSYQSKAIEPVKYLRRKDPMTYLFAADLLSTIACHEHPMFRDINLHLYNKDGMLSKYTRFESPKMFWDAIYADIWITFDCSIDADLFRIMRTRDSAGRREFSILAGANEIMIYDRNFWKEIVYSGHAPILLLAEIPKATIDARYKKACTIVDRILAKNPDFINLLHNS